jgi:hypothetical protein
MSGICQRLAIARRRCSANKGESRLESTSPEPKGEQHD